MSLVIITTNLHLPHNPLQSQVSNPFVRAASANRNHYQPPFLTIFTSHRPPPQVSNHFGTLSGGHYTALGRVPLGSGREAWYSYNDEVVSKVPAQQVRACVHFPNP